MRNLKPPAFVLLTILIAAPVVHAEVYDLSGPVGTPMITLRVQLTAGTKSVNHESSAFPLQPTLPQKTVNALTSKLNGICDKVFAANAGALAECKAGAEEVVDAAEQVYAQLYASYTDLEAHQMLLDAGDSSNQLAQSFQTFEGLTTSEGSTTSKACGAGCRYLTPVAGLTIPRPLACSNCTNAEFLADAQYWVFNAAGAGGEFSPRGSFSMLVEDDAGNVLVDAKASFQTVGGNTYTATKVE